MRDSLQEYLHLRKTIRQAGNQFLRMRGPETGIFGEADHHVYAYDISTVEDALDAFEITLPFAIPETPKLSLEGQIEKDAKLICEQHPSMEARDLARNVLALLSIQKRKEAESNSLAPKLRVLGTQNVGIMPEVNE